MNIYAPPGSKVVFAHPNAGYADDQVQAKRWLTVGETYTVDSTEVGDWSTGVFLVERPGHCFNSAHFEESPPEDDAARNPSGEGP